MNYFYDLSELNWEFFGFYDWIDAYHPEFYFVVYTQNLAIVSYLLTFFIFAWRKVMRWLFYLLL